MDKYDPNRPETEEDGIRQEGLRRLKVRQMSQGLLVPTRNSSPSPKPTPATME